MAHTQLCTKVIMTLPNSSTSYQKAPLMLGLNLIPVYKHGMCLFWVVAVKLVLLVGNLVKLIKGKVNKVSSPIVLTKIDFTLVFVILYFSRLSWKGKLQCHTEVSMW